MRDVCESIGPSPFSQNYGNLRRVYVGLGEHWFYDYRTEESFADPKLPAPHCHPLDQPEPAGAVPSNWQDAA